MERQTKKRRRTWIYYLTGLFSGMSVMAVELGAQRLLSPYFSASQIVWTIVIGVIMIAMALGNVVGGKLADKQRSPVKLFVWIFVAATWIALIPLFGKFVVAGVALLLATFVTKNYLIWASLASCVIVFVFPLTVLGMVTPNIVKFATRDLEGNGKIVGKVEACNTIGSIIGTFIPTFVSIPFIGTSWTFVVFAAILYLICIVYFLIKKRYVLRSVIIAVVILACGSASSFIKVAFWNKNIVYEGESVYNYIRIEDTEDSVIFSTNVLFGVQSVKMKEKGLTYFYYDYAMAAPVMCGVHERELDALILGLGTGTYAYQCEAYFGKDRIRFDGVEIDEKVVDLAEEYFSLPDSVNVFVEDGRAYLNTTEKKYDLIMVDAYRDISIPFQMSSQEFFRLVKAHLNDGGMMVVNMNMASEKEGSISDYLVGTIASVFDNVYTARTSGTNVELFASDEDIRAAFDENVEKVEDDDLYLLLKNVQRRMEKEEKNGYILTDDKAPVERLGMQVLDATIEEELAGVRKTIREKSFRELVELLFSGEFL